MGLLSAVLESAAMADESERPKIEAKLRSIASEARARTADCREALRRFGPAVRARALDDDRFAAALRELRPLGRDEFERAADEFERARDALELRAKLEDADRAFARRRYREATETYELVARALDRRADDDEARKTAIAKRARCVAQVVRRFERRLRFAEEAASEKCIARVEVDPSDPEELREALESLFASGAIDAQIAKLGAFVADVVAPALLDGVGDLEIAGSKVQIIRRSPLAPPKSASSALAELVTLFEMLHSTIDCKWDDGRTTLSTLGKTSGAGLFSVFESRLDVDDDSWISAAEALDDYLVEIRFVETEPSPLRQLVVSTRSSAVDRRARLLLATTKKLAEQELKDELAEACSAKRAPITDATRVPGLQPRDPHFSENPFLLQECHVSASIKKIAEAVLNALDEAHNAPQKSKMQILSATRNVLEMYYSFVPHFHGRTLATSAVDAALYFNNCHYLAHIAVGYPWSRIYPKEFACEISLYLTDQIQNLRHSAIYIFSVYVKSEEDNIKSTIRKSELNDLENVDSIGSNAEHAISMCLDRLENLQHKWQSLLPKDVYNNTISGIIDCLSRELIEVVFSVKEKTIGEDLAYEIATVYEIVLKNLPQLVNNAPDLGRDFIRLSEIVTLLKTPMFSIASLWKSEKSKLSQLYSSEEVKQIIRIVFPGSLQKSAVLNMIQ